MRAIFLLSSIFLFLHTSNAQKEIKDWHAVGSKYLYLHYIPNYQDWEYNQVDITKDTIIYGHPLREYKFYQLDYVFEKKKFKFLGVRYQGRNEDTVFYTCDDSLAWYIDSDTIGCFIKPFRSPCFYADSTISYQLDSIYYEVMWNGYKVKRRIYSNFKTKHRFDRKENFIGTGFTPLGIWEVEDANNQLDQSPGTVDSLKKGLIRDAYWPLTLECYSHPDIGKISFFRGNCNRYYNTSINNQILTDEILLHYNSETKKLSMLNSTHSLFNVEIFNLDGKMLYSISTIEDITISTSELNLSFVIVRVTLNDQNFNKLIYLQ